MSDEQPTQKWINTNKLLRSFIGKTVCVQFDHDCESYEGVLHWGREPGGDGSFSYSVDGGPSFDPHWLDSIGNHDNGLELFLKIPADELAEMEYEEREYTKVEV